MVVGWTRSAFMALMINGFFAVKPAGFSVRLAVFVLLGAAVSSFTRSNESI
jgi:hypothetical protein